MAHSERRVADTAINQSEEFELGRDSGDESDCAAEAFFRRPRPTKNAVTEKIGLVMLAIISVAASIVFALKKHLSVAEKIVFAAETIDVSNDFNEGSSNFSDVSDLTCEGSNLLCIVHN